MKKGKCAVRVIVAMLSIPILTSCAGGQVEQGKENKDAPEIEEELKTKLTEQISGEIVDSFYGDFNDDGKYEMWATVWDNEGVPYEDIFGDLESWNLSDKCSENQYNLETGREYKQLQIWYVDENQASLIDDYISMNLTEEFVDGSSSGWGEDTFYYPMNLNVKLVSFESIQQLCLTIEHTWMTARGWGIEADKTIALYGNEDQPEIYFKETGTTKDYELRDGSLCISEQGQFYLSNEDGLVSELFYPIYYSDNKFFELASVEVDAAQIESLEGYQEIYNKAMDQQLTFEAYEVGPAANVTYTLEVDNIAFNQCLYNDSGYLFLNGTASGMMTEFASSLGEMEPYYSEIDVCLEMKITNGKVVDYRWIGARQKESITDYEKVESSTRFRELE